MSINSFQLLLKCLHVTDNEEHNEDRLYKISLLFDVLLEKFQDHLHQKDDEVRKNEWQCYNIKQQNGETRRNLIRIISRCGSPILRTEDGGIFFSRRGIGRSIPEGPPNAASTPVGSSSVTHRRVAAESYALPKGDSKFCSGDCLFSIFAASRYLEAVSLSATRGPGGWELPPHHSIDGLSGGGTSRSIS